MSLETWKAEFLDPIPEGEKEILERELRKWIGLRPENLKKHGLIREPRNSRLHGEDGVLAINMETDALCTRYFRYFKGQVEPCSACPLYGVAGTPCNDQYAEWLAYEDPEPMIALIEEALRSGNERT